MAYPGRRIAGSNKAGRNVKSRLNYAESGGFFYGFRLDRVVDRAVDGMTIAQVVAAAATTAYPLNEAYTDGKTFSKIRDFFLEEEWGHPFIKYLK